jgi:Fe-S-cluster containining protein
LPAKGYVDKTPDGRCIHLEPGTGRCQNWDRRPRVCRAYSCNADPLLQGRLCLAGATGTEPG